MPSFVTVIAAWFGISNLRLIVYAVLIIAGIIGALTIRQHYINLGWKNAIAAVKKQDEKSAQAAKHVDERADQCGADSYFDVITQRCKGDAP